MRRPKRGVSTRVSEFSLACRYRLNLQSFPHDITGVGDNRLTLGEAAGYFEAVAVVAAHLDLLQVDGAAGITPVVIYASTDLMNWTPIFTNPPVAGSVPFLDSSATGFSQRFYRAGE